MEIDIDLKNGRNGRKPFTALRFTTLLVCLPSVGSVMIQPGRRSGTFAYAWRAAGEEHMIFQFF